VRRTADAGRYLLAETVARGPSMFDTAQLHQAGGVRGTDPDPITELGAKRGRRRAIDRRGRRSTLHYRRLTSEVRVFLPYRLVDAAISIIFGRREAREAIRRQVKYQRVPPSLPRQAADASTLNRREQPYDSERIQLACGVFKARQYFRDILTVQRYQRHDLLDPLGYLGFICQPTDGAAVRLDPLVHVQQALPLDPFEVNDVAAEVFCVLRIWLFDFCQVLRDEFLWTFTERLREPVDMSLNSPSSASSVMPTNGALGGAGASRWSVYARWPVWRPI
jgi:hypothetical protein